MAITAVECPVSVRLANREHSVAAALSRSITCSTLSRCLLQLSFFGNAVVSIAEMPR